MANRLVDVLKSTWNGRTTTPIADMVALLGSVLWNFTSGLNVTGTVAITGNETVSGTLGVTGTTTASVINASGKLTVSAGGAAITGGATIDSITLPAGTALTLYKEGTFTPIVQGVTTAGVGTYSTQTGSYTRLGQFIFFNLRVDWTAHTGVGNLRLGGLPVNTNASIRSMAILFNNANGATFSGGQMLTDLNATTATFTNNLGTSNLALAATGSILITGFYLA